MSVEQMVYAVIALLLLLVPLCLSSLVRKRSKGVLAFITVVGMSAFIMSSVVIAQWAAFNWSLESKIETLDRDGNGVWSQQETDTWTEEDHKNMDAYIGDGGRHVFAVIIFPIVSLIYSLFMASIYWLLAWLIRRWKNRIRPKISVQ
ncbi:hypothetical protein [Marinomonas sp. TW1]|uniref:hypothetical protein n=1 Tax=Marinomonas sp. TW1 TaxID=1561203 RepID=UPI0007AF1DC9|nr:hypothetical protein [Marinomonas sp. TW1]KZN14894.1 hypothetical protein OA79_04175 [Marinomonas sp. TW1]